MTVEFFDKLFTVFITLVLPIFVVLVFGIILLASLGRTLGIRRKYVQVLLRIFEFGKQRLAQRRRLQNGIVPLVEDEESDSELFKPSKETFKSKQRKNLQGGTHEFHLFDCVDYIVDGMTAIVDDEVTKRFDAEELKSWNFLTRTNRQYEFISVRLTIFWVLGFVMRYLILLPLRACILLVGIGFCLWFTTIAAFIPDGSFMQWIGHRAFLITFRIICRALSAVIVFHNVENKPKPDGICVANHTSPIDCAVLASENVFSLVGQRHGGFLGIFQWALSRASDHIWFERSESKDRYAVAKRLREHVEDPNKMPILIFPEGTCINNTSVMQFKKGTFEVGGIIYPVAIKYDARFGDAFWNSSRYSMVNYIYMMMTSWAIVCDVWYLPPMTKRENESSIDFANRVKAEIARQGGLVDLVWDGGLKRSAPKKELKEKVQEEYSRWLKLE